MGMRAVRRSSAHPAAHCEDEPNSRAALGSGAGLAGVGSGVGPGCAGAGGASAAACGREVLEPLFEPAWACRACSSVSESTDSSELPYPARASIRVVTAFFQAMPCFACFDKVVVGF